MYRVSSPQLKHHQNNRGQNVEGHYISGCRRLIG